MCLLNWESRKRVPPGELAARRSIGYRWRHALCGTKGPGRQSPPPSSCGNPPCYIAAGETSTPGRAVKERREREKELEPKREREKNSPVYTHTHTHARTRTAQQQKTLHRRQFTSLRCPAASSCFSLNHRPPLSPHLFSTRSKKLNLFISGRG